MNINSKIAENLICYNVIESDSNQSDVRIAYNRDQVYNIHVTIAESINSIAVPIEVIHIGSYQLNKPQSLIITFRSVSEAFKVMKNKISIPRNFTKLGL